MALVVVGRGRGCFHRWVALVSVGNGGGTDAVVLGGGSDRLEV